MYFINIDNSVGARMISQGRQGGFVLRRQNIALVNSSPFSNAECKSGKTHNFKWEYGFLGGGICQCKYPRSGC